MYILRWLDIMPLELPGEVIVGFGPASDFDAESAPVRGSQRLGEGRSATQKILCATRRAAPKTMAPYVDLRRCAREGGSSSNMAALCFGVVLPRASEFSICDRK